MRHHWLPSSVLIAAVCAPFIWIAGAHASHDETDPPGDALIRRTDSGNDGPIDPLATIPDILSISMIGWGPIDPALDPYIGVEVDGSSADIFRLQLVLSGLINPPGTLGLGAEPFDPFKFGPNPAFGFVEIDMDRDRDTGGELGGGATQRYLANVARFATVPTGSISARIAMSADDFDAEFNTAPQIERSGQDFSLNLCGCFAVNLVSTFGDTDESFDPGDTWSVSGRFFQRAGGYEQASAAFGGTFFGLYDPIVELLFAHDTLTDTTTITFVYPLTMVGAAALRNEPVQPIDLDVGNHNSVIEALDDIIIGASGPLFGPTAVLTEQWAGSDPMQSLDPERWRFTAIVGMSYLTAQPALYVWTDVAGDHSIGDFDGSGIVNSADTAAIESFVAANDGTAIDADSIINGEVAVVNPGANFTAFDLDGNMIVDAQDVAAVPVLCLGDADGDRVVNFNDITSVLAFWLDDYTPSTGPGDANGDGVVNFDDITNVLSNWLAVCP